ncbi:MAG: ABC transporter permease [Gammaproteobacteria bacterium]|nr:MAG: ABC transporter permease [Gammaproteobacteria bacterium]
MVKYIAQRLVMMFLILLGVLTITFVLSRILPGSPVEMMLGHHPTPEQIAVARAELGLDKSLPIQYVNYVKDLVQGDWGTSLRTGRPVLEEVSKRIGATFELTVLAMFWVVLLGVPIGIISAVRQNSAIDNAARAGSIAGVAFPVFMLAMGLQLVFYGHLNWLPLQGRIDAEILLDSPFERITGFYLLDTLLAGNFEALWSAMKHLTLPVMTLVIVTLATVTRITRNMMVEVLSEEYIRTAFAYGVPKGHIYYFYALKATLIPLLTVVGLTFGYLLGGAVVVEFVFDWPGLGGFVVFSIAQNDFPAVMGATMVLATAYLAINLIVDLLYHVVDPRFRVQ